MKLGKQCRILKRNSKKHRNPDKKSDGNRGNEKLSK
jgi:hypothetical protein